MMGLVISHLCDSWKFSMNHRATDPEMLLIVAWGRMLVVRVREVVGVRLIDH